ncbi:hypothetical protein Pmani_006424 [Petrolisthes manimaculis]|uniref:Uncharacterized protein n=1 Tax=Petrolisthes manimaculis TaxID=1843537 RepID=A0AAE1QAC3_9EUCA|nr:hypothetical protein Pmani_006424 [Petrolisthes manimaculis]
MERRVGVGGIEEEGEEDWLGRDRGKERRVGEGGRGELVRVGEGRIEEGGRGGKRLRNDNDDLQVVLPQTSDHDRPGKLM